MAAPAVVAERVAAGAAATAAAWAEVMGAAWAAMMAAGVRVVEDLEAAGRVDWAAEEVETAVVVMAGEKAVAEDQNLRQLVTHALHGGSNDAAVEVDGPGGDERVNGFYSPLADLD